MANSGCEDLLYVRLEDVDPDRLLTVLNNERTREHLVKHDLFDSITMRRWIKEKAEVDQTTGCSVRGIISGNSFAGWCGIQLDNGKYEIAIVLDPNHWGIGTKVFRDVIGWAKALGHDEVLVHLLHTRPEYKALRRISKTVSGSEHFGEEYTTYRISVA